MEPAESVRSFGRAAVEESEWSSTATPETNRFGFVLDADGPPEAVARRTPVSRKAAQLEVARTDKWRTMLREWDRYVQKWPHIIKRRVRKGVPDGLRAEVWPILCGGAQLCREHPGEYAALLEVEPRREDASYIERDLARTYPQHLLFRERGGVGQAALSRVLRAYAVFDGDVGYCQGMAFVAGLLLMYIPEEAAFWTFVALLHNRGLRSMYLPQLPLLQESLFVFTRLCEKHVPDVARHVSEVGIQHSMYGAQWFLTVFSYAFPFDVVVRVMDIVAFESPAHKIIFRVALAVLHLHRKRLRDMSFEDLLPALRAAPHTLDCSADRLITAALKLRVTHAEVGRLRTEFRESEEGTRIWEDSRRDVDARRQFWKDEEEKRMRRREGEEGEEGEGEGLPESPLRSSDLLRAHREHRRQRHETDRRRGREGGGGGGGVGPSASTPSFASDPSTLALPVTSVEGAGAITTAASTSLRVRTGAIPPALGPAGSRATSPSSSHAESADWLPASPVTPSWASSLAGAMAWEGWVGGPAPAAAAAGGGGGGGGGGGEGHRRNASDPASVASMLSGVGRRCPSPSMESPLDMSGGSPMGEGSRRRGQREEDEEEEEGRGNGWSGHTGSHRRASWSEHGAIRAVARLGMMTPQPQKREERSPLDPESARGGRPPRPEHRKGTWSARTLGRRERAASAEAGVARRLELLGLGK